MRQKINFSPLQYGWQPFLSALLLLLAGLSLTAYSLHTTRQRLRNEAFLQFSQQFDRLEESIKGRFNQAVHGMRGAIGAHAGMEVMRRANFRAVVLSHDLASEFPGVRGFGYIERVRRADLSRFEAGEKADQAPDFVVRSRGSQPDLYVVKYIEPRANNAAAQGLDLGDEPVRREAVERAINSGAPSLTGALTLVQDARQGAGFLYLVPVFSGGAVPDTPKARQAALTGLFFAPLVVSELLGQSFFTNQRVLDFELLDGLDAASQTLAFSSQEMAGTSADPVKPADFDASRLFHKSRIVPIGGRFLTLRAGSSAWFESQMDRATPLLVGAGGAALSLLLAVSAWLVLIGRARAEAVARAMTLDLARLAKVVRRTSHTVMIADANRNITWVNDAFSRTTGIAASSAIGKKLGAIFGTNSFDPQTLEKYRRALDTRTALRMQYAQKTVTGAVVWLDADFQPEQDAAGNFEGFVAVVSDVTEQKTINEQLVRALRENQALMAAIDQHSIVSIADPAGTIIYANEMFSRISGYSSQELIGQNHRVVKSEVQSDDYWRAMWQTISGGHVWHDVVCNRTKDGSAYWVDTVIAPFFDGNQIERYISIRSDVTALKKAQETLAAERERLNNIIVGTNAGTWEFNVQTGEQIINERTAEIIGYAVQELRPLSLQTWVEHCHPDDLRQSRLLLTQHLEGGLGYFDCKVRMRHRDGHWVWMHTRGRTSGWSADGKPEWVSGTHMDITEAKEAEAQLQQSASQLRDSEAFLVRAGRIAGVGRWQLDLLDGTVHWSDQTCHIHDVARGYAPQLNEVTAFFAPEARPEIEAAIEAATQTGKPWDLELPLITAMGRRIWVRSAGEAEYRDGKRIRLLGIIQEVTERRQLADELLQKNELMKTILATIPVGLSVMDGKLNLIEYNPLFRTLLDLPDALFNGDVPQFESIIRFNARRGEYGEGDPEVIVKGIMELARQAQAHHFERQRPNGTTLEIRGAPMPDGGFVTTYSDISERRKAEAEAIRSTQLLRGAIDAIDEAFVLFDPDDRLLFCNEKYRSLYALTRDLIVPGAAFEDLVRQGAERGQYPAAIGRIDQWVAERMVAHRAGDVTLVQRLDDGRVLRVVERKMPDGHIVGFRIDITELVRASEAAQQATVAKSQFLANMSHELRTPMNAILGMLKLMHNTELSHRQQDYTSKAEGAAKSLLGLLNDILDSSKIDAGKMQLDPQPFRIDRLLRDLSVILSANVGIKPVEVLFDIDPATPKTLIGDSMRLQQVLINLTGNAIKFTAQGEVVVQIKVLAQTGPDTTLRISVRDSGIGIAPEHQQHIFGGFSQAEASTTRRFGGTGLGLSISQRLVALMGGELAIDSALGRGSTFHFTLNLPAADPAPSDAKTAIMRLAEPLIVLVVDDSPTARELLLAMAQSWGWQVDVAASGAEAIRCVQARASAALAPYQAIFIDWQMPDMDGWETIARIHQVNPAGAVPITVMVTAHGREMLSRRTAQEQAGLHAFLVKPITASMLFDAVADARAGHGNVRASPREKASRQGRLDGLRLLVVEDNLVNQQVARELLSAEGAQVVIAANGQLGVAAVAAATPPFDAVLMDIQMPVMDGYTATRTIRQELGLTRLPIIAMTANAMASDREACLNVGMNDHVGKPFDLPHLVDVLLSHIRHPGDAAPVIAAQSAAITHPGAATPDRAQALPATDAVEFDAALERMGGNAALYGRILQSYLDEIVGLPDQLDTLLLQGDCDAAGRLLHTLKGLSATVGASYMAGVARAAEGRVKAGPATLTHDDLRADFRAAVIATTHLMRAVSLRVAPAGALPAPTVASLGVDAPGLMAGLVELKGLLNSSDLRALEVHAQWRDALIRWAPTELAALDAALGAFDFAQGVVQCEVLLQKFSPSP